MPSIYLGVILIGLIHGLEPGHGWPVAALYSLRKNNKYGFGLLSSLILSFFHLISSIAVVAVFIFLNNKFDLSSIPAIKIMAALLLFYMAYRFWTEKEHARGSGKKVESLWGIAAFAFILGCVHEEEFALLTFCLDNISCLFIMLSYAAAVALSLVGVTLLSIYAYQRVECKIQKYEHYLPKASALILIVLGFFYLLGIL